MNVLLPALYRDLFHKLDVDSSGGISIDELSSGLIEQGYNVSAHEVEQLMARLDLDADGNILFDEFAAGLLDWRDVGLQALKQATPQLLLLE